MTGLAVLIAVLVVLTTRSRRARRRWKRALRWCWWALVWGCTLVLPRSRKAPGRLPPASTRPAPPVRRPRVVQGLRWPPAPPRKPVKVDPSAARPGQGPRYFTHAQKTELLQIAGYQCQHVGKLGIRCHMRTQLRADHLHPYSWGGKTILTNGQILCDPHNVEKGAHWTDVHDPALMELVCVPHMLLKNRRRKRMVRS